MTAEPARHLVVDDGWTACSLGPRRRARRTTDPARVTCGYCLASRVVAQLDVELAPWQRELLAAVLRPPGPL